MHNNTNYHGWNKALTFGVGSIQLSFRTIVFTQYMQRCFSQIVQRVCTLVLFIILLNAYCQNSVSDRQTDGQNDKPSTVTLAAHTAPRVNKVGGAI